MLILIPLATGLAAETLLSRRCARNPKVKQRKAAAAAGAVAFAANLALFLRFGSGVWPFAPAVGVLAAAASVDGACRRIPNALVLAGCLVGLLAAPLGVGLAQAILGGASSLGLFLALYLLRPGALGLGDVKLAAFIGLAIGLDAVPAALGSAVLIGGAYGAALVLSGRATMKDCVPYGPILALGGLIGVWYAANLHL